MTAEVALQPAVGEQDVRAKVSSSRSKRRSNCRPWVGLPAGDGEAPGIEQSVGNLAQVLIGRWSDLHSRPTLRKYSRESDRELRSVAVVRARTSKPASTAISQAVRAVRRRGRRILRHLGKRHQDPGLHADVSIGRWPVQSASARATQEKAAFPIAQQPPASSAKPDRTVKGRRFRAVSSALTSKEFTEWSDRAGTAHWESSS